MLKLFRNIPRDPKTVAALRNECDARGLAARCREKVCGRARRCRAPWRADENTPDLVLPPCLLKEQIEFSYRPSMRNWPSSISAASSPAVGGCRTRIMPPSSIPSSRPRAPWMT